MVVVEELGPAPAVVVAPEAFLGALGTPPSANPLLGEVEEVGESLSAGEEEEEEGGVGDCDSWDSAKECRGSPNPTMLKIPPLSPPPPPPPPPPAGGGRMNPVL